MIECREVAKILGNSETLDLMLMREFLKSDEDDPKDSKFNFNSSPKSPKQRATKWENVLQSLRDTFYVERGMYDVTVLESGLRGLVNLLLALRKICSTKSKFLSRPV